LIQDQKPSHKTSGKASKLGLIAREGRVAGKDSGRIVGAMSALLRQVLAWRWRPIPDVHLM
jgi:hypothetical protein